MRNSENITYSSSHSKKNPERKEKWGRSNIWGVECPKIVPNYWKTWNFIFKKTYRPCAAGKKRKEERAGEQAEKGKSQRHIKIKVPKERKLPKERKRKSCKQPEEDRDITFKRAKITLTYNLPNKWLKFRRQRDYIVKSWRKYLLHLNPTFSENN